MTTSFTYHTWMSSSTRVVGAQRNSQSIKHKEDLQLHQQKYKQNSTNKTQHNNITHCRQECTVIPTLSGEKYCLLLLCPCTPKKEFQREVLCLTAELVLPSSCINSTTTTVPPLFQNASLLIRIGMMQKNLTHLWGSHDYVHYMTTYTTIPLRERIDISNQH